MQLPDHPDFHLHVGIKVCSDEDMLAEQDAHVFGQTEKKVSTWLNQHTLTLSLTAFLIFFPKHRIESRMFPVNLLLTWRQ